MLFGREIFRTLALKITKDAEMSNLAVERETIAVSSIAYGHSK